MAASPVLQGQYILKWALPTLIIPTVFWFYPQSFDFTHKALILPTELWFLPSVLILPTVFWFYPQCFDFKFQWQQAMRCRNQSCSERNSTPSPLIGLCNKRRGDFANKLCRYGAFLTNSLTFRQQCCSGSSINMNVPTHNTSQHLRDTRQVKSVPTYLSFRWVRSFFFQEQINNGLMPTASRTVQRCQTIL